MESEARYRYAHHLLGLTRQELARRLSLGQIDPQILNAQIDENAREVKLQSLCEKWIEAHALEQVDKDIPLE